MRNKISPRIGVITIVGILFVVASLLTYWLQRSPTVATSTNHAAKTVNLEALFATARAKLASTYPQVAVKDASDTANPWAIAGEAPGYNFSTSVDLGKNHLAFVSPSAVSTVPASANSMLASIITKNGGKLVTSPVPTTYPSEAGHGSYYTFSNAACYVDYQRDKSSLSLDCATNAEFAKVAASVQPFVALYQAANKAARAGNDYAVHAAYTGKTTGSSIVEYAAVPLNGTVAYFYKPPNDGWHYYAKSGTGIACNSLSGVPKTAFATLCKS